MYYSLCCVPAQEVVAARFFLAFTELSQATRTGMTHLTVMRITTANDYV